MKLKAALIMSMLLTSTLVFGTGVMAQDYTGSTIAMFDWNYHEQDYFEPSDDIYFDVTVLDNGLPMQSETMTVVIWGDAGIGEVFYNNYTTDSYGQFQGYDGDDNWYTHDVGDYTIYVNYSGVNVVNMTFEIYDPVPWSAIGWTSYYYGAATSNFTEDEMVEVHVRALDQLGNPYDGSYADVWYEIMHNGYSADTSYLSTNVSGEDSDIFYTDDLYNDQFGVYTVYVYNDAMPPDQIGMFEFNVILPEDAVVVPQYYGEDRAVFTAGEHVGYHVTLYYNGTTPYNSDYYAARILLFKQGVSDPLANDTLDTDWDGEAYDYNFYNIGYSEDDKGTYRIRVYTHDWDIIGTGTFMVIDLDISLEPYKSVYSQGDDVVLSVSTSLEEAYTVLIADWTHTVVPGASWDVAAHTSTWVRDFTFPEIDDGTYYVDVYTDNLRIGSLQFELKKFTIEARLSTEGLLPGQSGTLFWMAVNNHDGGPISITGDVEMNYIDDDYNYETDTLADISGSSGSFTFTVPTDAMIGTGGDIDIDAEDSADHQDSTSESFSIGSLRVSLDTDRTTYRPGESVYMTFSSFVSSTGSMVPNVEVRAQAQHNGVTVGSIWTVTTDASGYVDCIYAIPATAAEGTYVVVMNATFNQNRNVKYNGTDDFSVNNDPVISLLLYQEMSFYAPGDTVTVPYRVLRDGTETTGAQVSYEARLNGNTIALGFGSSGSLTISLPSDVEGSLDIYASALTSDGFTASAQLNNIEIAGGQLVVFTAKNIYLPGETVNWYYILAGDTGSSAYYRITDPTGVLLAEGVPTDGNFTFTLPTEFAVNPTATVFVVGGNGNYIASRTAQVYSGYLVEFTIQSNSYAPGDIMKLNYTIIKIGQGPETTEGFQIQISIVGEYTDTIWVTDMFGIIEYQLPEDIRDGRHVTAVTLVGAPDDFADVQTIIIDSDAGELAHGTIMGMNASAFVVLILAIVALIIAIIGVVMWRRASKPKVAKTADVPPPETYVAPEEPVTPQQGYYPPPPPTE